ncbi:MAG: bacteriohemerythrin [Treponema sp.]|nr:bacteriohemerythrin [Treponema sp.]MCL2273114.1 bacteriohemerythrin [Treponema sp.]
MIAKSPTKISTNSKDHVTWNDSYSLGIKLIDDQHKGLIDIVNDIFNHATGRDLEEHEYFKDVIKQAVDYVKNHFATEEKIMISTKYKGYDAHKKSHEEFILKVIRTAKDYESGKRLTLTSFGYFLKDWVLTHIAVMDKKYCDYFRSIATVKADGKLSISLADIPK